jgi:hypothetical protein
MKAKIKEPKFNLIPQFTRPANYQVDIFWSYVEDWVNKQDFVVDIDPDFQRGHVWTEEQQVRYVEFILRGGASSRDIYWNCSSWMTDFDTPLELVDGKQRIQAVRKFMKSKIKAFGYYFKDFTDRLPLSASFRFHVNNLKTRADVLQWYLDLNDGGVVHTSDELNKVRKLLKAEKIINFVRSNKL